MAQPSTYLQVYITYPDEVTARRISKQLIDERLIAGANIMSAQSEYRWQGAVQQANEYACIAQSTRRRLPELVEQVEALHPYELPCITYSDVEANPAFVEWVHEQTQPE